MFFITFWLSNANQNDILWCWEDYWDSFMELADRFWKKKCVIKEYTSIRWLSSSKIIEGDSWYDWKIWYNTYINWTKIYNFYLWFFWWDSVNFRERLSSVLNYFNNLKRKWYNLWVISDSRAIHKNIWIPVYVKADKAWEYLITWAADDIFIVKLNWVEIFRWNSWENYYILPVYLNKWDNYLEFFYKNTWGIWFLSAEISWPFDEWSFINDTNNGFKSIDTIKNVISSSWDIIYVWERFWLSVNWPKAYIDKIKWNTRKEIWKSWFIIYDDTCPEWYHPWLRNPISIQSWQSFRPDICIKYRDLNIEDTNNYILENNPYFVDGFFIKTETKLVNDSFKTFCTEWFYFPKNNSDTHIQPKENNFECITPDSEVHKKELKKERYRIKVWNNSWIISCGHWAKSISFNINNNTMVCERTFYDLDWVYLKAFNDRELYVYSYNEWLKNVWAPFIAVNYETKDWSDSTFIKNESFWKSGRILEKFDMSHVLWDNMFKDNENWNYREYRLDVTHLCSNIYTWKWCHSAPKNFKINVYADNKVAKTSSNTSKFTNWSLIADWQKQELIYKISDKFWNYILPVKKANWDKIRDLNFQFFYKNNLYANQYNKNWQSGIKSTKFYNNQEIWEKNLLDIKLNKTKVSNTIDDISIKDWQYKIWFKAFVPTHKKDATDGRQYAFWNTKLIEPTVNLSDNRLEFFSLYEDEIDLQFKPKFITSIAGSLIENWLIVWIRQDSNLLINKNFGVSWKPDNILLEYWKLVWTSKKIHDNFDLSINKSWSWQNIASGNQTNSDLLTKTWLINNNNLLSTLLRQKWTVSNLNDKTYIATHIEDFIDWIKVVYSSFAIWLKNYELGEEDDIIKNTFQRRIKITWNVHSLYKTDVYTNDKILQLWNISKSELQKHIRKRVVDNIRNIKNFSKTWVSSISNLNNLSSNWWVKVWDTLYFEKDNWENITISWSYSWVKNIVIYGWNAYITWNIIAWNKKNDILSIISVEKNGKGWNIYIKPSVEKIDSVLYADKAVLSYDWTKELDPDNWWTYELLKNQLYIYGSVFSNNTIWGSVLEPFKCPFYEKNCNLGKAEKYDLYNLRRWYENIYNTSWWKKPYEVWNLKPENVWKDLEYTLIIEYNPLIQSSKNPFFTVKK